LRHQLRSQSAQVAGDLVGEHFFEPETEQVRCVAAVGPSGDNATRTG
jgi:hypothetical protein